jgi:hypothetical protein
MQAGELASDLIGRPVDDARALSAAAGLRLEVLAGSVVDAMVDPGRIRVRVANGMITQAWADPTPGGQAPESGGAGL